LAHHVARKYTLPLAGLFLDWVPIMRPHFGHAWARSALSRWFRRFYNECDLAFCTSDGMQELLGPHPNSHVIYPMPGRHRVPEKSWPPSNGKFRLVYVGSVENFYGRMLYSLIEKIEPMNDLEIIVVGPNADWPKQLLERARAKSTYLGFKPPEEAAEVLASADALLSVMSFESEHELLMRTSFTTKFLDYVAFEKPVILWGPEYCTPVRVARKHGGAVVVNQDDADAIVSACRQIAHDAAWREQLSQQARQLHQTLFDPDRLQEIFVGEIEKLVRSRGPRN
jgi:glycosyltransferase involved in cell wall biosynthesis